MRQKAHVTAESRHCLRAGSRGDGLPQGAWENTLLPKRQENTQGLARGRVASHRAMTHTDGGAAALCSWEEATASSQPSLEAPGAEIRAPFYRWGS